jgi:Rap1a immunity proteins
MKIVGIGLLTLTVISTFAVAGSTPNWLDFLKPSSRAFETGNSLYATCTTDHTAFSEGYCMGFIAGTADTMEGIRISNICSPEKATVGQVRDVVLKYLAEHPETRQNSAFDLIQEALVKAWPCHR